MEWRIITVTLGTCSACFSCMYYCFSAELAYKKLLNRKTAIYKIYLRRRATSPTVNLYPPDST